MPRISLDEEPEVSCCIREVIHFTAMLGKFTEKQKKMFNSLPPSESIAVFCRGYLKHRFNFDLEAYIADVNAPKSGEEN